MNDVALWFSMLVRKLLKPGNFTSVAALKAQVRRFIAYFTRTMAKPLKWGNPATRQGNEELVELSLVALGFRGV